MANLIIVKNTGEVLTATEVNAITQMITAPAAPSMAFNAGVAGFPTLQSAVVTARTPDTVTYFIVYSVTPGAAGAGYYGFFPPTGWTTQSISYGAIIASSGMPVLNCLSEGGDHVVQFGSAVQHKLIARATIVKN